MTIPISIIDLLQPQYVGIFLLMLSAFLIGYFSSLIMEKNRNKTIIKKLKKKVNNLKIQHNSTVKNKGINNIETIFTEIKPKILKVVHEAQEKIEEVKNNQQEIAERTRTSFVTYTKSKPELNFENFGEATKSNSNDLTKLNGIGPYIEQRLNDIGIYNYDQISRLTPDDIRKITELIDFFPERIERDDWVGQAYALLVH
ncbi:MAG: hypothetical protein L3J09_05145 [Flavobacteriaceae bacterium]|nr:hypothetical protein [Flavobacteriaceae bacterium]